MASRSLGTLTLDLVAKVGGFTEGMDKADRKSRQTAKQIEKYSNQIGAALTAATAAGVTGMAALVTSTAESAREIRNFAELSDASTQQFQRITYAASRYNLEQEKVADILKDTNDRVGDFIQTGGGPMADFFENIAPLVGVTADEFARLSGPEALQLYFDSLQKANVSQKDMTFYMEAIASDASLLIPLLRDGGAEMERLGDEAERTGNVFSDMEFEQLESISQGMDELTAAATGMKNEVVLAAIPAIDDLINILTDPDTVEAARALGGAIVTSVSTAVKVIRGAVEITQFLAEELAAFVHGPAFGDLPRMREELEKQERLVNNLRNSSRNAFLGPSEEDVQREIDKLEELREQYELAEQLQKEAENNDQREIPTLDLSGDDDSGGNNSNRPGKKATDAAKDAAEAAEELEKALADMRAELDPAMDEFNRYADQIELIEQFNISAGEKEKLREEAFAAHQERMHDIAMDGEIQRAEDAFEVRESYLQEWLESAEENLQNFDELSKTVIDNFTTGFGNAIESVVFDAESLDEAFAGVGETILRSVVNALAQMAAQWLAMQAVQAAVGTSATAATVAQAATASSAWATPAALASLASYGANAAPAAAALASTTALAQGIALTGMAHDGIDSVPKTGTWLLEQGERVTTRETSAKLDATLDRIDKNSSGGGGGTTVNVIEDNRRAGQTETTTGSDGRENVNVFVSDIMGGGPRAKTMERIYGLRRQGQ